MGSGGQGEDRVGLPWKRELEFGTGLVAQAAGGKHATADGTRNPKKSDGLLRHGRELRYQFIRVEKAHYPVTVLCQVLKISGSGFYAWMKRERQPRADREPQLLVMVRAIHTANEKAYGSRRMSQALRAAGEDVGRYQAGTLMKKAQIAVKQKKRFRVTTDSTPSYPVAPNRLNRQFDIDIPNTVWGGDITYVWTDEGWLYLAVVVWCILCDI